MEATSAQSLPAVVNESDPDSGPKKYDYVVMIDRTTGGMKFSYLMIDRPTHSLCPMVGKLWWAWLNDWVEFRACVLKNYLYIIGGREKTSGRFAKKVLKYNALTGRWTECALLKQPRIGHTATAFDGKVWVMGK